MSKLFKAASSPHIRHEDSTAGIMFDVILALMPAAVYGCIMFGYKAALVLLTTVAAAVLAECLWNLILKKPQTVTDFSAALTGLLLGMNLSPRTPLWIAAIGSVAAIIVVKQMFGGLGYNFVNPALSARVILLVSFPSFMTVFSEPTSDVVTSATPLADIGGFSLNDLFFGTHAGCIGETSVFLLLFGGLYLIIRRVINPIIPLSFIGTVALFAALAALFTGKADIGEYTLKYILSGGLMLGAIFMATDYVTSPTANLGKLIFGIGCGAITFVIRYFGSLPEGVSYSILLMNIVTPLINRIPFGRPFGYIKEVKKDA
ncbi:MAG: RnfABCDGE type electron transport complex subunit D [Clostridia bacterium]|nr:RnfABCDGE type electron transport complex subunit D [Clostridia bacterium]